MSRDTVNIMSFAGGLLSPWMIGRIDFPKYTTGCVRMENFIPLAQGPATFRPGFTYVATAGDVDNPVILIPFVFSRTQAYVLEFGHEYMRVYMDQGQVQAGGGGAYEIVTPYSGADLSDLHFCQSIDVLFICHPDYAPRKLTRTAHDNWTLSTLTFGPALAAPTGLAIAQSGAGSGTDHTYVVTTISPDTLEESDPCSAVTEDGPASLSSSDKMTLTWNAVSGAEEYWVYKEVYGIYAYLGKAGAVASPSYTDDGSRTPDESTTPPEHPSSLFGAVGEYPRAVTIYQQRLCFAGTDDKPTGLWFSRSGAYTNFGKSSPVRSDDAVILVVDADQNNAIQWVFPGKIFLFGTVGGEWTLTGAGDNVLTPTSFHFEQAEYNGSENLMPAIAGSTLVFLEEKGGKVRELIYSFDADGMKTNDLSILAEHLLQENTITSWAYQKKPYGVLWAVRDDGDMLGLTYQRDHQVVAWHIHSTQGEFESVAVIPGEDRHEVWAVVKRTIDGTDTRFIEIMNGPFMGTDDERAIDAMFLDAMLTYGPVEADIEGATSGNPVVITSSGHPFSSGDSIRIYDVEGMTDLNGNYYTVGSATATTFELAGVDGSAYSTYTDGGTARKRVDTISGVDHLANMSASVLADGAVHPEVLVTSGGVVSLDYKAEVVHIGLPYTGICEPMPLQSQQTQKGKIRQVKSISIELYKSLGGKVGPDDDRLESLIFRTDAVPFGQAPPIFTGEYRDKIFVDDDYDTDARVVVVQDQPLPLTLVSVTGHLEITEQ